MVAVINIFLLLVMTSGERPSATSIQRLISNEELVRAVLVGDLGAADSIVKGLLAERFSQDLNDQAGKTVMNTDSFWSMLVKPEWFDLSKNILNLSSPLIALTIADQILSIADSLGQADKAKTLAETSMENFSYGRQVIPSWETLSRARSASTKQQAAASLKKERDTLNRQVSNSYQASFKQISKRWNTF